MRDLFVGIVPFVYAAQERSFRRAAERLGITPAAVSKAIHRLEDELGVQLLNRTTRRVEPSPEGELFLARCQEAMAQVRAGREHLSMAQRDPAGELWVSLPFILGRVMVGRLSRFLGRYPALKVHLHLTDRYSRLVDESIDVAIRVGETDDSTLVARNLMQTRWVTVAAPAYLARHGTPRRPRDLEHHNCVKFRSPRGMEVEWTFAAHGAPDAAPDDSPDASIDGAAQASAQIPRVKTAGNLDLDQGELLLEAAAAGLGVCQALDFMAEDAIRAGRLVEVLRDFAAEGPRIYALCLPGQRSSPRIRAFLDFLVHELARPRDP